MTRIKKLERWRREYQWLEHKSDGEDRPRYMHIHKDTFCLPAEREISCSCWFSWQCDHSNHEHPRPNIARESRLKNTTSRDLSRPSQRVKDNSKVLTGENCTGNVQKYHKNQHNARIVSPSPFVWPRALFESVPRGTAKPSCTLGPESRPRPERLLERAQRTPAGSYDTP